LSIANGTARRAAFEGWGRAAPVGDAPGCTLMLTRPIGLSPISILRDARSHDYCGKFAPPELPP
jgi:hypothetical protein